MKRRILHWHFENNARYQEKFYVEYDYSKYPSSGEIFSFVALKADDFVLSLSSVVPQEEMFFHLD